MQSAASRIIVAIEVLWTDIRPACEDRWRAWRPSDYLVELRRRKMLADPDATRNLHPTRNLDDPLFFLWSIHNTRKEVFGDLEADAKINIRSLIRLRNQATHDPSSIADIDADRVTGMIAAVSAKIHATASVPMAKHWPPAQVSPPPGVGRIVVHDRAVDYRQVAAGAGPASKQVLPLYVVCDTSLSMKGAGVQTIEEGVNGMLDELCSDPVISDKVLLSLLAFATEPKVLLPLTRPMDADPGARFAADGLTNYGRMFRLVSDLIDGDMEKLVMQSRPLRPVVFVITDGDPTDSDWVEELDNLCDAGRLFSPTVVVFPCGFSAVRLRDGAARLVKSASPLFIDSGESRQLREALQNAIQSVTRTVIGTVRQGEGRLTLGSIG